MAMAMAIKHRTTKDDSPSMQELQLLATAIKGFNSEDAFRRFIPVGQQKKFESALLGREPVPTMLRTALIEIYNEHLLGIDRFSHHIPALINAATSFSAFEERADKATLQGLFLKKLGRGSTDISPDAKEAAATMLTEFLRSEIQAIKATRAGARGR